MKKKILVTGAAGYIGSMLCTQLVNLGFKVVAADILKYDKNSLSHLFYFKNFKFVKVDISRPEISDFIYEKMYEKDPSKLF